MQESDSADNRQVTVSESEKGWLAGLIDGEGSIHIDIDPRGGSHPYLTITNTNRLIIEATVSIWHRLGIGCRVQNRNGTKRPIQDVQVIGYKRLKPALIAIMPYLIGKADQALTLYQFVESRLSIGDCNALPNNLRKITDKENNLIRKLKEQKFHNKIPRDYTPNSQSAEDIVRATQRCVEVARNERPSLL